MLTSLSTIVMFYSDVSFYRWTNREITEKITNIPPKHISSLVPIPKYVKFSLDVVLNTHVDRSSSPGSTSIGTANLNKNT
jgi:hypothetical protein